MPAITLHVSGMHCKACVALVESELMDVDGISHAKASFKHHHVTIEGKITNKPVEDIINLLDPFLKKHGYHLTVERIKHKTAWREFLFAVPLAIAFLAFFAVLQKSGLVDVAQVDGVNVPTAFFIGVIASLSTCMAVVGGLTLSMMANFAKDGDRISAPFRFHIGRLAGFFILGGLLGTLGSQFEINPSVTLFLNALVAAVMLVLGINLLDVLPFLKKWQLTLPRFIADHMLGWSRLNHAFTPVLIGVVTFFLPCGFTQSMQLYALSTARFMDGAIIMLVFALGTLPVLSMLSFAPAVLHSRKAKGIFFKTAGMIVIAFAFFNLLNVLGVSGLIQPIKLMDGTGVETSALPTSNVRIENDQQFIEITAKNGYTPATTTAKAGMPTILKIKTDGTFDCSATLVIPALKYNERLPLKGMTDVAVPAQQPNTTLHGMCGMGMYDFTIRFVQ